MNKIEDIIKSLINSDIKLSLNSFIIEQNDEITNSVRKRLDELSIDEIKKVSEFLSHLLNMCYNGKLYKDDNYDLELIDSLDSKDLFLYKETVIYLLGRLAVKPNIELIKKAYYLEDNKYVKLNLVFTSLCTFDEEIELDFVKLCIDNDEYDLMLRSWTMAYFKLVDNPYDYVDSKNSNFEEAKLPRIKRLAILEETNEKYEKAMSFRLMDLLVLFLFVRSRNSKVLTEQDIEVIKNTNIEFNRYSTNKKELMYDLQEKIIDMNR